MNLETIPQTLEAAAERGGTAFTFVRNDGQEIELSYPELLSRARRAAGGLIARGMRKGDRVGLILAHPEDFVPAFLGVEIGGGIPVPIYPPLALSRLGGFLETSGHILAASGARFAVTGGALKIALTGARAFCPKLAAILPFSALDADGPAAAARPSLDDPAFIQFTSGSTARPKGVVLSYANIAANAWAIMREGLQIAPGDRGVSWLPLYHDMGLIGFVLAPLLHRLPTVLLSPLCFLRRPARWLLTISRHRGTVTWAPNFAYALASRRIEDAELAGVDLSCLRVAGCGSEPIRAETLRRFAERFSPFGLRAQALWPSYGLAESSLAVSFSRGLDVDRVDPAVLTSTGRAVPCDGPGAVEVVCCGSPFPGHAARIADPATLAPLPERTVGELWLQGPSVMRGYFDRPEATQEALVDGWLRTGDLAYFAGGQLYLCGRRKDLIIANGRKYHPQDLEWAASQVEGVRVGNVAAFAVSRPALDREAIVLAAEIRPEVDPNAIAGEVRAAVHRALGLELDDVVLLERGGIPKTSSGKIRRSRAKELYVAGELTKPRGRLRRWADWLNLGRGSRVER